jgi:hypothetical protein
MAKEVNRVAFEIEHYNGETYMAFMLSIKDDGTVDIIDTKGCDLADIDGDYIFDKANDLYRVQSSVQMSEVQ